MWAGGGAGTVPHCDAAGQDALDGASVQGAHDDNGKIRFCFSTHNFTFDFYFCSVCLLDSI